MNKIKIAFINNNIKDPDFRGAKNTAKFNCRICKYFTIAQFKNIDYWYCKYAGSKLANIKACQYAECQAAKQDLARMVV